MAIIPEVKVKQENDVFTIMPLASKISTYESIL